MAALKKQGGCNYCNGSQGSLAHRDSKMANKAQCVPRRNIDGQPTRVLLKCIIKRSRIHESRRKHGKSRFLAHFQVYNSTGLDTVCSPLNVTLQPSAPSSVPREDWTMRTESVSSLVLWLEFWFSQCKATIGEWRERVRGEGIYSPVFSWHSLCRVDLDWLWPSIKDYSTSQSGPSTQLSLFRSYSSSSLPGSSNHPLSFPLKN